MQAYIIVQKKQIESETIRKNIAAMLDSTMAHAWVEKANQSVRDYCIDQKNLSEHMQLWIANNPKPLKKDCLSSKSWHQKWQLERNNYINTHFSVDSKMFEEYIAKEDGSLPFWVVEEIELIA